ncbi:MAG: acetyltransferase [Geminicoccaceae bacterium]|jgi:sugar O-acyltransferase (sialic acid O-acetyltransferase NeuD family)|nr:acetyltransferase [Geminicoccaceae bacterium]
MRPTKGRLCGLIGAGGFGREVMPLLEACVLGQGVFMPGGEAEVVFVESRPVLAEIGGRPVLSLKEFLAADGRDRLFNVAIAESRIREELALACLDAGGLAQTLVAGDAEIFPSVTIGDGAIICGRTMITDNVTIGRFFHCNIYSYVAHDCVIGDFVTFGPRVSCNGNVRIDDHAYVGAGAVIRQGAPGRPLVIGKGAVVGMGAVVVRDVAPCTTVVGNPARPLDPAILDGPEVLSATG